MPLNIPYNNFIPLTTIYSSQVNSNNGSIKTWADTHEVTTTGIHGVGAGNIVGTANANTFTNINTFSNALALRSPAWISNARLSISGGIAMLFTESGISPTASAPVYIRGMNSSAQWETRAFNSVTYCLIQDATSADSYFYNGVAGTPWGTTSGVAWADRMPLFIYMASEASGANPCLFFARKPNLKQLPSSTGIGYANNPPSAPSEGNVFAWTTLDVTTTHDFSNCILVGYCEATKDVNDDWTFYWLSSFTGGIGNFNFETNSYNMPISQNGAAVGGWFAVSGGGTAPTYTNSNSYTYFINRDGKVMMQFSFTNLAGGVAGAGAGQLTLSSPFTSFTFVLGNMGRTNAGVFTYESVGRLTGMLNFTDINGNFAQGADQNNVTRSISGSAIIK